LITFPPYQFKAILGIPFVFQKMSCPGVHERQITLVGRDKDGKSHANFFAKSSGVGTVDLKMLTNMGGPYDVDIFVDDYLVHSINLELPTFSANISQKLINGTVGKTISFNINNDSLYFEQVRIEITDANSGRPSIGVSAEVLDSSQPGKTGVSLHPSKPGDYGVRIMIAGRELPGGHFRVHIDPVPEPIVQAPREPKAGHGLVGRVFTFPLVLGGAKIQAYEIEVRASVGGVPTVPCFVSSDADGQLRVTFTPSIPGTHNLQVVYGGKTVGQSNVIIDS